MSDEPTTAPTTDTERGDATPWNDNGPPVGLGTSPAYAGGDEDTTPAEPASEPATSPDDDPGEVPTDDA